MHRKLVYYAAMFILGMWTVAMNSCTIVKVRDTEAKAGKLEVESQCLSHFINFAVGVRSEADSVLAPKCDETAKRPEVALNAQRLRAKASYYLNYGKMPNDP